MKISGLVCVRNGISLDYCFQEAIQSLVPACDEVVVCDSDSDDGTTEVIQTLAATYPTIRIINRPWTKPWREITWWTDWLNWARERLEHPLLLQLDGDEVLCPKAIPSILEIARVAENLDDMPHDPSLTDHGQVYPSGSRWFHRLNFWKDTQHLVPPGRVCGEQVVRMGSSKLWLPSDEPHPEGLPEIQRRAGWPPNAAPEMRIFHYGFLRKEKAFIEKVRAVNGAFFGVFDDRIARAEAQGTPWLNEFTDMPMVTYYQEHPPVAHAWLKERGYAI